LKILNLRDDIFNDIVMQLFDNYKIFRKVYKEVFNVRGVIRYFNIALTPLPIVAIKNSKTLRGSESTEKFQMVYLNYRTKKIRVITKNRIRVSSGVTLARDTMKSSKSVQEMKDSLSHGIWLAAVDPNMRLTLIDDGSRYVRIKHSYRRMY
jgi:ribosomal protein L7/L12